jgi:histidinol dehydrogenase
MMAYGAEGVMKVSKIFGPGNHYVTAAKMLVSIDKRGCPIDMPAGPSEVLIIADGKANPAFIAADLLSQAEHGKDSQTVLISTSERIVNETIKQVNEQVKALPRKKLAAEAIKTSFALLVDTLDEAFDVSNDYAPEHLILHINQADKYKKNVINAGSVFLGAYSPESVGDYASGTNHSLPTYGYAKSFGGITVESFMKPISFQSLTKEGLQIIGPTVETIAETEGLAAHKNSVSIRLRRKK